MEMQWKQNGLLGGGKEGKCKVIGRLHGKRICMCVCGGGGGGGGISAEGARDIVI